MVVEALAKMLEDSPKSRTEMRMLCVFNGHLVPNTAAPYRFDAAGWFVSLQAVFRIHHAVRI